jgi:DNA-binding transcriptional MocR family regulator
MGLSQAEIQRLLRTHQKRLQMGDSLPSISELADRAGLHRDTLYQAIAGQKELARYHRPDLKEYCRGYQKKLNRLAVLCMLKSDIMG